MPLVSVKPISCLGTILIFVDFVIIPLIVGSVDVILISKI